MLTWTGSRITRIAVIGLTDTAAAAGIGTAAGVDVGAAGAAACVFGALRAEWLVYY